MLISFKVSNSRSIGKELEFSAIATDDTILPENTIDLPKYGIRILKTMALFGANASGKTNILKAFADARNIICKPEFDKKDIFFPFNRNNIANSKAIISYSFTFLVEDAVYNYSFKHSQDRIIEELLTENIDAENEKLIYQRNFNIDTKKYEWLPESFFNEKNTNFFQLSTAEHKLFLTIANNPVNSDAVEKNVILEKVYNWFRFQLKPIINLRSAGKVGNYDYFISFLLKSKNNKEAVLYYLKKIDIHIEDIEIIELSEKGNGKKFFPYPYINPDNLDSKEMPIFVKTYHKAFDEKNKPYFEVYDFFREESEGTKIFLEWLGFWLYHVQKERKANIFVIDELGTSLHPKLTLFIMKLFSDNKINWFNSQLIFTTHEVKLMDKTVMRPDQLYLVNKDNQGNTMELKRTSIFEDIEKYTRLDTLYMYGAMSGMPMINL